MVVGEVLTGVVMGEVLTGMVAGEVLTGWWWESLTFPMQLPCFIYLTALRAQSA